MSFRRLLLLTLCGILGTGLSVTAREKTAYTEAERAHWSLQLRRQVAVPSFPDAADRSWCRNPIDAFVLARLADAGLRPAPEADRQALIRRVTFHLTGLPPSPEEIERFTRDDAPDAYERLVDRLLASLHHGEHWGQHWLDVVRFAETEGFEYDRHRPGAWRYRDWVIRSFNEDKPYDRFVTEQIAGDELRQADPDALVAVGFHRLGPVRRNAGNSDVAFSRNEVLTEMTDAIGSVFLGLTLNCARCHDHKFDPILQKDYYRLQAFLASAHEHDIPLANAEQARQWQEQTDRLHGEIRRIREAMQKAQGQERDRLALQVREIEELLPPPLPTLSSIRNQTPDRIHVLRRGLTDKKLDPVGPRVLGVLVSERVPEYPSDLTNPRTTLARWIAAPENPLTARVLVNRLWQQHFGTGLVATPNDFGLNGSPPSHPELLDYLANELVAGGWKIKRLHRMILTSSTYRQGFRSPREAEAAKKDPANRLLWHFARRRLTAEQLRDAMLASAGTLHPRMGGPSVISPVEDDLVRLLYKPSQWQVSADPREHQRRSVYLIAKRNLRLPFLEVFDQPDLQTSCPRREASTHAPQALELLNGTFANEQADRLARRLRAEVGDDKARQVERAFFLTAGRKPLPRERELALAFLERQPLREFALAMFSLSAFLYVE